MNIQIFKKNRGQALVTFIFFIAIMTTVTSGALAIVVNSSYGRTKAQLSSEAYTLAESGVENALLRIVRDPDYSGETMNIGDSEIVVAVTGDVVKTIISTATTKDFVKQITATTSYNSNGELTVTSWKESY